MFSQILNVLCWGIFMIGFLYWVLRALILVTSALFDYERVRPLKRIMFFVEQEKNANNKDS